MSRWWRAYDDAVDHPKLVLLSDRAHRGWFNLMCVASATGGALPDIKVIAVKLRMTVAKAQAIIAELKAARLIDENETVLQPHNWNARQYKSDVSTERVQRFRKRKGNVSHPVSGNVSETPPDNRDREQRTERKKDAASAANGLFGEQDPDAELFRRGKEILGKEAGGLIAKLKKANNGSISKTRSVLETAAKKDNPREYIGRIVAANQGSEYRASGIEGVT